MALLVDIFRALATVFNVTKFLSPVPAVLTIYRNKSTGPMPFLPLVSMVANNDIWMIYGWLAKDYVAILGTCTFGVLAACVYVGMYYQYTIAKSYAGKWMAVFTLVVVININSLYSILGANGYTGQSYSSVRDVVGYNATISSIVMYSSPLEKIRLVFKHRSAVFIPIQIVAVGAINSATWVVYSLLDTDWMVFTPCAILLVVGLVQIALYFVFHPSKHPLPENDKQIADLELAVTTNETGKADKSPCYVSVTSPLTPALGETSK